MDAGIDFCFVNEVRRDSSHVEAIHQSNRSRITNDIWNWLISAVTIGSPTATSALYLELTFRQDGYSSCLNKSFEKFRMGQQKGLEELKLYKRRS
jgi:hypothetical protein